MGCELSKLDKNICRKKETPKLHVDYISSMKRVGTEPKRGVLAGPETLTGPTYDVLAGRRVQLYYYYLWGQGALC